MVRGVSTESEWGGLDVSAVLDGEALPSDIRLRPAPRPATAGALAPHTAPATEAGVAAGAAAAAGAAGAAGAVGADADADAAQVVLGLPPPPAGGIPLARGESERTDVTFSDDFDLDLGATE